MKFLILAALVAACHAATTPVFTASPYLWTGYQPYAYSAIPYAAPVAAVAPVAIATKYHAQDVFGQASFGHAEPLQSRAEVRDVSGNVAGQYSYVDPNGKVNVVQYTAGHGGFRVIGNNLPEAPVVPQTPALVAPEPVQDTPEVVAARADFARKFAEAAAAAKGEAPAVESSRRRRAAILIPAVPAVHTVLPAVAKTTLKVNQYEPVNAAVPASTRKLELKEREHEIYTPLAYSAVVAPAVKTVEVKPVEVKTVEFKSLATPYVYNYGYSAFPYVF